jgi:hypothetical protein
MYGQSIKNITWLVRVSGTGFYHQVFFTLTERLQFGGIQETDPPAEFILGRDGFMAQVET